MILLVLLNVAGFWLFALGMCDHPETRRASCLVALSAAVVVIVAGIGMP